ncbi:MAG: UDP-N-acetylmuramoyl-tripeptide--D-alanyl-D-alanine ligase [Candidatus Omnitrophica bacterium]|nr:UDP-N-acetylmuramoyl-tripeptide--D-alanyl-D-alanine ligase [Candidatus Omnitrophota bacterium]MCM8807186.1 UDP-N-acetylmuramoyl-tripeptide--D-alanyl-D-alanine ligase [Candidatus Omnitrophota bacterium]
MENVKFSEIVKWCNGKVNKNYKDFFVKGISTDTRNIKKDEIFIALKGEKFDGHNFVKIAFEKGAIASIVNHDYKNENSFLLVRVKDTLKALGDIGKNYREKLKMKVIGITGSDGKTTTKEIIKNVLSEKFITTGTIGNYNNEIGLPLSIIQASNKVEIGVFEMGMNKKGEIYYLSKICQPNLCVITNIGNAHIGFFKNRKEIADSKSEIFENLIGEKQVFLNRDDRFFNYLKDKLKDKNTTTIGVRKKADINGEIIEEGIDYFIFKCNGKKYKMNFWNTSFIYSGLFGIAIGKKFEISENFIANTLSQIKPFFGRGEITKGKIFIIDESYNSNPNSLKNALLCFEKKIFKRKIAIIGDMAELGKFTNFYHYYIGKLLKNLKIDIVLTFGEKSKLISDICNKGRHFYNIEDLKKYLRENIKTGDSILIKGSRILKMEEIVNFLKGEV